MPTRVLLTGGAGYIGSHVFLALREAGFAPVILDDFSNSDPIVLEHLERASGVPPKVVRGDVRDTPLVRETLRQECIEAVIHLAARKSIPESICEPRSYISCNIGGLTSLIDAMSEVGIKRLVFSSSAAVYGEPDQVPVSEDTRTDHTNPYAFTKLKGEQILNQLSAYDDTWQIGILRYFNPAGAHPSGLVGEQPRQKPDNLFPAIARVLSGKEETLSVFGIDFETPDGSGIRDFIHVSDLAEGHVQSLQALASNGTGHLLNLGTGTGHSVLEVIKAFEKASGRSVPYKVADRRPGDVASCFAKVDKAKDLIGFRARRNLDDMAQSAWNWVEKCTGRPTA